MVEQKYGVIIMISSVKAFEGSRSLSYGASKAGLVSLAKSYARAVSKFGVRVNSISPSMVETDMEKSWSEEDKEKYLKSLAINRFSTPKELASFVKYVCSDDASFITGTNLFFDGGYMV
jgi:3-oxoacyl-[acyl-carrier protein] reductase